MDVTRTRYAGTARRLFFAFTALVAIFAVASYMTFAHLREIRAGLEEATRHERGIRLALELASAVRDQYAHQAHTIILGNTTHMGMYTDAERHVVAVLGKVAEHVTTTEEKRWTADIQQASAELDQLFRGRIVPAVVAARAEDVQVEHGRAQLIVSRIEMLVDQLVGRFEEGIAALQERGTALQEAAFRWALFFLVGAPVVAGVVGLYVFRSVARPVRRLRAGAARIAEGDLETRIDVDTPDEFGDLARQFNLMTDSLKEHQERLIHTEKLAGIGRLAAGVAHEINNPLAVILGYVRLMAKKAEGPLLEDLKVIEQETLSAKGIVEGLLDLSRPLTTAPEVLELRAVCEDAVARLKSAHGLERVTVAIEGSARVIGHPHKLGQVLVNLVKNGAEAAGPGGSVAITIRPADAGAEIEVTDSGQGVTPIVRSRLFEPFFTTKPKGTGLGLAVSQGIVRAHGGDILIGNGPNGGARFIVRLPEAPPGRV